MDAAQAGIVPVASGEAFDALRARWGEMPTQVKFSSAADSPEVGTPFGPIYILLRGEETGGQLGLYEQFVAPGTGAGPHHQTTEDEVFYVLEGEYIAEIGDKHVTLHPGDSALGPRGVPHAWACVGNGTGKLLISFTPAGKREALFNYISQTNAPLQDAGLFRRRDVRHAAASMRPRRARLGCETVGVMCTACFDALQ